MNPLHPQAARLRFLRCPGKELARRLFREIAQLLHVCKSAETLAEQIHVSGRAVGVHKILDGKSKSHLFHSSFCPLEKNRFQYMQGWAGYVWQKRPSGQTPCKI